MHSNYREPLNPVYQSKKVLEQEITVADNEYRGKYHIDSSTPLRERPWEMLRTSLCSKTWYGNEKQCFHCTKTCAYGE